MAIAPVQASAGQVVTAASGSVLITGATAGNILIVHGYQDGVTGAFTATALVNMEDLDGAGGIDPIITAAVGSPTEGIHQWWIARVTANGTCSLTLGVSSGSDDMIGRFYEFSGVSKGTTLATVAESTGSFTAGTNSATLDDCASSAPAGPGRVNVNLCAVNANLAIPEFTGESNGDWIKPFGEFSDAVGSIAIQTAVMGTLGISGGTATISPSSANSVVGFRLVPEPAGSALRSQHLDYDYSR